MTSFSKHIAYKQPDVDHDYWWYVSYDLSFKNGTVTVGVDIDLSGVHNAQKEAAWLAGIKQLWNERGFLSDGSQLYDVTFNVKYVNSGEDYAVTEHQGDGDAHFNMLNWYVQSDWGEGHDDVLASHEFGHMIGNYDEYDGGSTHNGHVVSGTLMSDLTPAGFQNYFDGIQKQTEKYGFSGHNVLSTVLAVRGYDIAETMTGTAGMDGIYGNGGADSISGYDKNDFLDGGGDNDTIFGGTGSDRMFGQSGDDWLLGDQGNDTLAGGSGADTMDGGANKDRFVFDTKASAINIDTILSFSHTDDTIVLESAIFTKLGSKVESAEFYAGRTATHAHDKSDRIVYNKTSGWLYYDDDGNKSHGHSAVHFATLSNHPSTVSYTDFIVV